LNERKVAMKRAVAARKRSAEQPGINIRGRWVASRQAGTADTGVGPAFDGSQGVDSEDIINIPQIGFGTFQLFPDQDTYGPPDTSLPKFNQTVQIGLDWINRQAETAALFKKPVFLSAFGLVTQENAPFFVPFDSSASPSAQRRDVAPSQQPDGISDSQLAYAYFNWAEAVLRGGLGIIQYQWSQSSLQPQIGSPIAPVQTQSGTSSNQDQSGVSPNDGYGSISQGFPTIINSIQGGATDGISQS